MAPITAYARSKQFSCPVRGGSFDLVDGGQGRLGLAQRRWRFDNSPLTGEGQGRGTHGAPLISFSREYATAFYWSFLSIMGSDMLPNTQREQWFTIIASFFGLGIVSAIIGGFSSTLAQLETSSGLWWAWWWIWQPLALGAS